MHVVEKMTSFAHRVGFLTAPRSLPVTIIAQPPEPVRTTPDILFNEQEDFGQEVGGVSIARSWTKLSYGDARLLDSLLAKVPADFALSLGRRVMLASTKMERQPNLSRDYFAWQIDTAMYEYARGIAHTAIDLRAAFGPKVYYDFAAVSSFEKPMICFASRFEAADPYVRRQAWIARSCVWAGRAALLATGRYDCAEKSIDYLWRGLGHEPALMQRFAEKLVSLVEQAIGSR